MPPLLKNKQKNPIELYVYGWFHRPGNESIEFCTGVFDDHSQILDSNFLQEKPPHPPFFPILLISVISIFVFMISIQASRHYPEVNISLTNSNCSIKPIKTLPIFLQYLAALYIDRF